MSRSPRIPASLAFVISLIIKQACQSMVVSANVIDIFKAAYYDPKSGVAFQGQLEDAGRLPFTRIGFGGLPCACQDLSCGCCVGINITTIKFDRRACTNFTYDPDEFSIRMDVTMNEKQIFSNGISAKNPPPLCMPLPYVPAIDFCIRFYDVFTPGNNLHACVDFETRIVQSPVLIFHFDCVKMGYDGLAWIKPEGSIAAIQKPGIAGVSAEPEVYDEVHFEQQDPEALLLANKTTTLSPEDEDKIGQLKL
ncbi:uncharacterized protein LOC107267088 [Cephus cinctus]|uniref:Uncharacterized protein LOC107267088 n=1 Tax=Cephus cinctus TaxID=211228 RepID=A0AAJ7BU68_CEPCN|nr:uncharacterized protein LOC107267088 [Cephus cinctus]